MQCCSVTVVVSSAVWGGKTRAYRSDSSKTISWSKTSIWIFCCAEPMFTGMASLGEVPVARPDMEL